MRSLISFVLRMYIDSDVPERLCGELRPLGGTQFYPFKNENEFEALLRQLIGKMSPPETNLSEPHSPD